MNNIQEEFLDNLFLLYGHFIDNEDKIRTNIKRIILKMVSHIQSEFWPDKYVH